MYLFLRLHSEPSKLLLLDDAIIFLLSRFRFGLPIFRLHLDNLRRSIKSPSFPKLDLAVNPRENLIHGLLITQVDFFYHAGTVFHFEELELVYNLFYVQALG